MKKSFYKLPVLSLATAVILGMTACGSGGSSTDGAATGTTSSSGSSSKGPFKQGSTVIAYKLNNDGTRDINTTTITVDNKGTFNFSSLSWSGPTEFVIYGDYLNENTGSYMTLPFANAISAVSNVTAGSSASVNINVLTNIAAKSIIDKMASGTDIDTAKTEAETSVKKLFNLDLGAGVSLDDLDPTDASTNTKANTQLLLVSSAILKTSNPEQVMQTLAEDMSDGTVDGTAVAALAEVKTQTANVNLQQVAANMEQADIGVTNPPSDLESTLAGLLAVDNNISFAPKYDYPKDTNATSDEVTIDGIYGGSGAISINGGWYSINGATWTSDASTVSNGQKVRVRVTSASDYSTPTTAILTIGGAQKPFSVTTQDNPFVADTSPATFDFGYVADKSKTATNVTSPTVTISGINTTTPISVVGGKYKINNGAFTTTAGTVSNDDNVTVSGDANTTGGGLTTVALTVGDKIGTFKIFTAPDDTTPDVFTFNDAVDVDKNTTAESNVTITGINIATPISVVGGEYKINNGAFTTTAGTVSNNDNVTVRGVSANSYATTKTVMVTVGNVVSNFNIITKADPFVPDTIPNALPSLIMVNQNLSATVTTQPFTISGINTQTTATITGGSFDINGSGNFVTDANISNGDAIRMQQTTADAFDTAKITTLSIGGVTATLKTITQAQDAIPDTFSFDTNASVSIGATDVVSNTVTISGINTELNISVSNGEYSLDGGNSWSTDPATVTNGDTITLRQPTVATAPETPNVTTLTVGSITTTFTTVTLPAAPVINTAVTAPTTATEDAPYTFTPELNATSGSVESWSIVNKPAWAIFNIVNGKLEGIPRNENVGIDANISIIATNAQGSSTYGPFDITVVNTNDAPTAEDVNATTTEDTAVDINVTTAIHDVDVGDSVNVTAVSTPSLGTVTYNGNILTYTPNANVNGIDSFIYTVSDTNDSNATATVYVTIAPVNDAPVAQNDIASTNEDTNLTIPFVTLLANDSDVDSNITVVAVTNGTNGTAAMSGDNVIYAPNANFNGTDIITYTVSDGNSTSDANVTITVFPVNDSATITGTLLGNVAEDVELSASGVLSVNDNDTNETTVIPQTAVSGMYGSFSVDANGSWEYTLDNNASDVQALISGQTVIDSFNVTSLDGTATQPVVIDVAGSDDTAVIESNSTLVGHAIEDTLMNVNGTITVEDKDANQSFVTAVSDENTTYGVFSIAENGNWIYTVANTPTIQALAEGETVSELITVISLDTSASSDINITITGTNDAPVVPATREFSVMKDTNLSIQLSATDVDHNATLTLISASATDANVTIVDTNGSIIFNAPNTTNGVLNYTLEYTFSDEHNATVTGTDIVHVSLSNPPVAENDTETVVEDTNTTLDVLSNDTDDNDAIVAINIVSQPSHGIVSVENNTTLIYAPAPDYNGPDAFQYNIVDEDGLSSNTVADVNITVTAVNDAPVAMDDSAATVEDTNLTIPFATLLTNDSDVDDDNLTITAVTDGANGTASISGTDVIYSPDSGFSGQDSFVYTLSDGSLEVNATVTVTVTPANNPPVLVGVPLTILHNETMVLPLHATDDDNDTLTYSIDSNGSNLSRFSDANITSSGVLSFRGGAIGVGSIVVDVNDSKTITQATYTVSVIGPQNHYDGYEISDGGSVPAATYDNYSAIETPKDVKEYSLEGMDTENNVTTFDVTYAKFDTNGTFEMLDEDGLHNWSYSEDSSTHEITITNDDDMEIAAFKLLTIEDNASAIASDLNLSMPDGAVVYKVAFKMLQDEYDFWDEVKDWNNNGATYDSLQAFVDNKIATQSRTNYQRALVFAPDANISAGSGTLAEADLTAYNYTNHTTPPVILNENAGTWTIVRNPQVDNNNSDILLITPNDTSMYESKIYVLDNYDNATNTVWEGEFNPAGTVWLETDFNEKALAVVKNVAKVVTPFAYAQNLNINSDSNATEFADLNQTTDPSGLTFNSVHVDMNSTDYNYRRLELAFTTDGNVTVTEYVNETNATVIVDNEAYTYNADENVTLGTTVLKIGPDMNASTLYDLSGLSFDSNATGYLVGHDDNETSYDKGIYFNPEAATIVKANFDNFENSLNYTYAMIDNRTIYMIMADETESVVTFVNDNGVRTMYETDGNNFVHDENPQEFSYAINADGDIELSDQGDLVAIFIMDSNTGATQNVTVTNSDGSAVNFTATIYLNENDAREAAQQQP